MIHPAQASQDELLRLLDERTRELRIARQEQAVTAEVLRAINRGDFDLETVLNTLTKSAADLCGSGPSALFVREDDRLVARGTAHLDADQEAFVRRARAPIDDSSYIGRAVLFGTLSNVDDFLTRSGSSLSLFQEKLGFRALLVVPLMRDGQGIGVFTLAREPIGAFTEREVERARTFADQAAIAVANVRQMDELRARTGELAYSLAQLEDAQERLARSARLASLGRLVAGVAHEMNTPIGNALTIASSLEHDATRMMGAIASGTQTRSELVRGLERLGEGSGLIGANLARAIELIRRFRQVSSDDMLGQRRPIEARSWLEGLLRSHPTLAASGHATRVDCPDGLVFDSYPERLGQAVTCLIENSLTHAYPAGETGRISLSVARAEGEKIVLIVGDDGRGIAPADLGSVFEPFYTTARSSGAAGLGLHIAHNLVASCGGQIAAASLVGEGARFTIHLPPG